MQTLWDLVDQYFGQHLAPFFDCKERLFFRMDQDCDYDFVKKFAATFDDVQVAVSDGIE